MQPTNNTTSWDGDHLIATDCSENVTPSDNQAPTIDNAPDFRVNEHQSVCFGGCFPECSNCPLVRSMAEEGPGFSFNSGNAGDSFLGKRRRSEDPEVADNPPQLSNQTFLANLASGSDNIAAGSYASDPDLSVMPSQAAQASLPFHRGDVPSILGNQVGPQDMQFASNFDSMEIFEDNGNTDNINKNTFGATAANSLPFSSHLARCEMPDVTSVFGEDGVEGSERENPVLRNLSLSNQMALEGTHLMSAVDSIVDGEQAENIVASSIHNVHPAADNILENRASYPTPGVMSEEYPCDFDGCLTICATRDEMVEHKHLYHSQNYSQAGPSSKIFFCEVEGCKKQYTKRHSFLRHGHEAHGEQYLCAFLNCSEKFDTVDERKRHVESFHGRQWTLCTFDSCTQAFRNRKLMLRHRRQYHLTANDKRMPCDFDGCGRLIGSKASMAFHKRSVHFKVTKTECDFPNCNQVFSTRGNMLVHMRDDHERFAPCHYENCKEHLVGELDRTRHIADAHPGLTEFHCKFCGKRSACVRLLKHHIEHSHKAQL